MQQRIVIIGGGASGCILAARLLKRAVLLGRRLQLILAEPNAEPGKGVAYGTSDRRHLLNVPASNMSALAEEPGHFYEWYKMQYPEAQPSDFAPRADYGNYLKQLLESRIAFYAVKGAVSFRYWQTEVVSAIRQQGSWLLTGSDGQTLDANVLVLATGNAAPDDLPLPDNGYLQHPGYFSNPWVRAKEWTKDIAPQAPIFFIGTGLTMIDVLMTLDSVGHRGTCFALSTHGLLPARHVLSLQAYPDFGQELLAEHTPLQVLKIVRKHLRNAPDWRTVIDALRPHNQRIWQNWNKQDRLAFLQHLAPYWAVLRHRMAPSVHELLQVKQHEGQLQIAAGRVLGIQANEQGGLDVRYRLRGDWKQNFFAAAHVFNCTGPRSDMNRWSMPLVRELLEAGWIRTDALRLGLDGLPSGQLLTEQGLPAPNLYCIGPPTKANLWESTAIPEIRLQAQTLEACLLQEKELETYFSTISFKKNVAL